MTALWMADNRGSNNKLMIQNMRQDDDIGGGWLPGSHTPSDASVRCWRSLFNSNLRSRSNLTSFFLFDWPLLARILSMHARERLHHSLSNSLTLLILFLTDPLSLSCRLRPTDAGFQHLPIYAGTNTHTIYLHALNDKRPIRRSCYSLSDSSNH